MSVDVANESGAPVDEAALVALSRHVLGRLGIHPQAELSLLLVGVDAMSALHERWMDEPGPTDVLSFPMDELRPARDDREPLPGQLGDIVMCPAVAATQAVEHGRSVEAELHLLCTHGILHLLGYDHADADEKREMFELQASLLTSWEAVRAGAPLGSAPISWDVLRAGSSGAATTTTWGAVRAGAPDGSGVAVAPDPPLT